MKSASQAQTERRAPIHKHYANGAVQAPLQEVKPILGRRRWTSRNADRMNLLPRGHFGTLVITPTNGKSDQSLQETIRLAP